MSAENAGDYLPPPEPVPSALVRTLFAPTKQAASMTGPEILREAEHRYLLDATFHAQVEQAVFVLMDDLYANTGARMSSDDRALATHAAAVALVVARLSPDGT